MTSAYQFLRPFAFLAVKGPTLDLFRWTLPLATTVAVCAVYAWLPIKLELVGDKSASDYLIPFFSSLPGFFIAALAAVVAFAGGDLDKAVPGVKVSITVNGDSADNEISLRVFLSYLFAYLTMVSFLGFFFCVGGSLLAGNAVAVMNAVSAPETAARATWWLKCSFLAGMAFFASSIVFCTVQGLYFLAERVHQKLL
ncbi:hypothetical protein [Rhizobium leguminosarum]|uniref:hypothetical protein n=1 Tax=Rhizobium TaxID=379 RepID=UPI00103102AF|nr:hypothetical protein [Rhizobium leguminosarum]TAV54934.1 hypothetical protein ELI29_18655 [Rhizobium leguminosarum]